MVFREPIDVNYNMAKKTELEIAFLKELESRFAEATEVKGIADSLTKAGYEPYLVGGCLRDLILGRVPKDWDIATNATPDEIRMVFPNSVYENQFGTVGVKTNSEDSAMQIVEVTTFRKEMGYTDRRHPDKVMFAKTIEEDLARRDFTINAMAFEVSSHKRRAEGLVDPFGGRDDLENKLIRAVGEPNERFGEDALRLMRAVRLGVELNFEIEKKTGEAIKQNASLINLIAKERIRDELTKILMAKNAKLGIEQLEKFGLLEHIVPELREGIDVEQNKHHKYTVWEHSLNSLDYAALENYSLAVRLAALFHDVAKPRTKTGDGPDSHFFSHEVVSAEMVEAALGRLCFSSELIDKVIILIRYHMFKADPEEITEAAVRRTIRAVGPENIWELINLRTADRIGSGVPKAWPYRLRSYMALVEKNLKEPIGLKQMVLKGDQLMELLRIPAGPRIGWLLYVLFEEVLDEPSKNNYDYLSQRAIDLGGLSDRELEKLAEKAKESYQQILSEEEEEIKKRYYVE